jgi:hypothetical protein
MGPSGFTSYLRGRCAADFYLLGRVRSRKLLSPVANTLTTTPPRRFVIFILVAVRTLNHSYFRKSIWFPWNLKCRHSITSHASLITFGCLTSAAIILFTYKFLMWDEEVTVYYIIVCGSRYLNICKSFSRLKPSGNCKCPACFNKQRRWILYLWDSFYSHSKQSLNRVKEIDVCNDEVWCFLWDSGSLNTLIILKNDSTCDGL